MRSFRSCCFALAIAFVMSSAAWSQTAATGQISGTVIDSSKAVIPNASITVTSKDTGLERNVTSSSTGTYSVNLLPPGDYDVTVKASGFETEKSTAVAVQVATTATVNFEMRVGQATEEVKVEAAAETLQTQDSTNGETTTGP